MEKIERKGMESALVERRSHVLVITLNLNVQNEKMEEY